MNRHQGRELSCEGIYRVLNHTSCTRLAVCGDSTPYIVPMNFTWDCVNGRLHFFLTSRCNGEKMRHLSRNNRVALEFELCDGNRIYTVVARGSVVNSMGADSSENDCSRCGMERGIGACNSGHSGNRNGMSCCSRHCNCGEEDRDNGAATRLDIAVDSITGRTFCNSCEA